MIYFLLLLLLALLLFAAAMFINASAFRPPVINEKPADGRKVTFNSGKNQLVGYIWNENGTRGLIILAHGIGTSVEYHLPEVRHFADAGYKVFAFEYTGYGESTGHFYGFPQAVSDLKNAIEFIDDGTLPVILLGHSMGGYAVCAVAQCLSRRLSAIVAYAPFYSPGAAIEELTRRMPKCGWLIWLSVLLAQYALFGARHRQNGIDGLRAANAPTLILQGSRDDEVSCDGCSLYARRKELTDSAVTFRVIENEDSCGHMTVIRKNDTHCVNEDTMKITDAFLRGVLKEDKS